MKAVVRLAVLLLLAAACEQQEVEKPRLEPIVVYADYDDEEYLPALFEAFRQETGIPVMVRSGDAAQLTDDVIAKRGAPPADVLMTRNVSDAWRAADEGALRPITAANMTAVASFLRDPDDLWVAVRMSVMMIAVGEGVAIEETPTTYAALGDAAYKGSLCLSSSSLPANRALISMLIDDLGPKPAERLVRGWVRNLALPVFASEQALLEALDAGTCTYGIVPDSLIRGGRILPDPAYVDIEGAGIARHARHPESAQRLVDWLLSADVQWRHARDTRAHPALENLPDAPIAGKISRNNVGVAGWYDADAVLLAERAGYR